MLLIRRPRRELSFVLIRAFDQRSAVRAPLCPTPSAPDHVLMETATLPEVHRAGGLIGAEIRGLDLTREYPDETYEAIRQAWAEHGVIFFRDQHLNAEQRESFARRFGEIRVKQELRKEPDQTRAIGEGWHTDMTCFDEQTAPTSCSAEEFSSR